MVDIGGLINRLTPLIEKRVREECILLINTKTEAEKLSSNLKEVQKVLEEAERRRLTDPRVRSWLERLQDVTYEIDDALDEWDWETANVELEIQEFKDDAKTWLQKVSILILSPCSCFKHVIKRRDITLSMRELNEKVDLIAKETAKYTLLPISGDSQELKGEITTSFGDLLVLKGQENEKKGLVDDLLSPGQEPGDIQVISLVGMAGVGKTTIAQLAFNEPRVQSNFEPKSWTCVSHASDKICYTKAILQSLGGSCPEDYQLQKLLELIVLSISGKKFLLVLDHVWIQDDSLWKQLKASLRYGAPGSRILVTTTNQNITKLMGSSRVRTVDPLSDSDCGLLFSEIAFRGREKEDRETLGDIGRIIAKKCEGMPHAAKTLAYYLHSRFEKELWKNVLEKEVWELEEVAKPLFAPLAFDYDKLPLAVKHCFSYCAIFDRHIDLDVDELIRIWMVQGYLSSSGTDNEMELKGLEYIEILAARSFFKILPGKSVNRVVKMCRIHPILHDFARYLRKTGSKYKELQSFYSENQLPSNLDSLKSVRLLFQRDLRVPELPFEVDKLIHLRYLDLAFADIKELPATICNLYNLQSLGVQFCVHLSELPEGIHKLRNLKHLLNHTTPKLERFPQGLEQLTSLRTLENFKVVRGKSRFGYLANLNQLRGSMKISIEDLKEEEDVDEAKKSQLNKKIHISDLNLVLLGEVKMEVMEALQAPPNLEGLCIDGYKGTRFPGWVSNSLNKLRKLDLHNWVNFSHLLPLGTLPFLEYLTIINMKSLELVGPEFLGLRNDSSAAASIVFPKLRILTFMTCGSWREWIDVSDEENSQSIMPCLNRLIINGCPKLEGLPHLLLQRAKSLKWLSVSRCPLLAERYRHLPEGEERRNDWEKISHIPNLWIED